MRRLTHILSVLWLSHSLTWAATSATSKPVGIINADVPAGLSGFSFPLIEKEILSSTIAMNDAANVAGRNLQYVVFISSTPPAEGLTPGGKYYLEITSGPREGDRFEVDQALTAAATPGVLVIDLASTNTTFSGLTKDMLLGATASIRPHMTLAKIQAMFDPPLVGNNNLSLADSLLVFNATSAITYYLRADGVTWRKAGTTADFSSMVIPPDQGVMLQLRSGAKALTHQGVVRGNAFRINFKPGLQPSATGFPASLSPVEFGAIANPVIPQAGWIGSNVQSQADGIMVFDQAKGSFTSYYLRSDGLTWRTSGSVSDQSGAKILRHDSFFMVKRQNADDQMLIPKPY
jgi:hypothetical protein